MTTTRGFYTIVNVHHDSWIWADVTASGANYTMIEEKFYRLWYQIGTKLACKGSQVAFEPINEPPVSENSSKANASYWQKKYCNIVLEDEIDFADFVFALGHYCCAWC